MSKSSKLASAAQILAFVASRSPDQVTTEVIAEAICDHPTRVRQIVASLVKAELLLSVRGANGGVGLSRPPETIDLGEVYEAIGEQGIIGLEVRAIRSGWRRALAINAYFNRLYPDLDRCMIDRLRAITLAQIIKG